MGLSPRHKAPLEKRKQKQKQKAEAETEADAEAEVEEGAEAEAEQTQKCPNNIRKYHPSPVPREVQSGSLEASRGPSGGPKWLPGSLWEPGGFHALVPLPKGLSGGFQVQVPPKKHSLVCEELPGGFQALVVLQNGAGESPNNDRSRTNGTVRVS